MRRIKSKLYWFSIGFEGIYKHRNKMDAEGILIIFDMASQMLKELEDEIGDREDRLQVQKTIEELRVKVVNSTEAPLVLSVVERAE